MSVLNVHERRIEAPPDAVGALVDSLASEDDRVWPVRDWPRMRLDRGLTTGSAGGHGPIRYEVTGYEAGRRVSFRFTGPSGFHGHHELTATPAGGGATVLRHTLALTPRGTARLSWPLAIRWFHDALIEDAFDRVELTCTGALPHPARWNPYVRLLRAGAALARRR
ncbi:SRPBCC family protein [Streptomyces sp. NPDC046887]|uniref:SRPBCC family protein n=1 Tax=Streptomyces sp. NPDC046887 TaxID=3155472 RepID=UPI00340C3944